MGNKWIVKRLRMCPSCKKFIEAPTPLYEGTATVDPNTLQQLNDSNLIHKYGCLGNVPLVDAQAEISWMED